MADEKRSFSIIKILLVLLLITVIGSIIFFAATINRTINSAVSPIQNANQAIGTHVSKLLHPTPTIIPDPVTIIREVQSLARLETIQYTVEKVITAEINQGVFGTLFGDRLLFVAHGFVIAGVDLSMIKTGDFRLEDGVLYITLPKPEVFVATLNNDASYVYDRTTGILRKSDQDLETNARQAAEDEIRKAALDDGILVQAEHNAEMYLERLLNTLGYKEVIFED